jgi:hypothetical protein
MDEFQQMRERNSFTIWMRKGVVFFLPALESFCREVHCVLARISRSVVVLAAAAAVVVVVGVLLIYFQVIFVVVASPF